MDMTFQKPLFYKVILDFDGMELWRFRKKMVDFIGSSSFCLKINGFGNVWVGFMGLLHIWEDGVKMACL